MTAFEKYLVSLGPEQGALHLIECMTDGPKDSQAWDVMVKINGEHWKVPPKYMPHYCLVTVIKLSQGAPND